MNNENPNNHPAYQSILDVLPESLHSLVIPKLKEWDAGVTKKFQEIHAQYEPLKAYQKFVDNEIDPEYMEQAVIFADQLQRDPKKVVSQINESWDLGYLTPEQAQALQATTPDPDEFDLGDVDTTDDLLKNPKFKELYSEIEQIKQDRLKEQERSEEEAALAEFETYLDQLEKDTLAKNLPFNRTFVTALVAQGLDGEEAVNQFHQVLATSANTQGTEQVTDTTSGDDPPVVMGGDGVTGSGTPDGTVNFGKLSKGETAAFVEQMLAQAAESGQG